MSSRVKVGTFLGRGAADNADSSYYSAILDMLNVVGYIVRPG